MRALLAGPCISEFGWEICEWQGHVRKMAQSHDAVVVCSTAGHAPLYTDLNPIFIPHHVIGRRDCHRMRPGSVTNPIELQRVQHELDLHVAEYQREGCTITRISPIPQPGKAIGTRRPIEKQLFVKYGDATRVEEPYSIIIHARAKCVDYMCDGDDYPEAKWLELLRQLVSAGFTRIAAIGLPTASIAPAGVADLRGSSLQHTMDLMAAATVVVGPSSGPMHLASLCGTPHVVWATDRYQSAISKRNKDRYETYWHPLPTPVKVLLHKKQDVLPPSRLSAAVLEMIASLT